MATPPTVDIATLTRPISDEQPAGPELRSASDRKAFDDVRDARKKAIDAERRLRDLASMSDDDRRNMADAPEPPDWEAVRRHAIEALTRSKDLWVAAWLIEGLTRLYGFAGLRDGIRLTHQLCDKFWENIHPQDMGTRFSQLAGLDGGSNSEGTLILPILSVPITAARTIPDFSLADYKDAAELERKPPEIRQRRLAQGALTLDQFNQAVAETNVEFFQKLIGDLESAEQAVVAFSTSLREKEDAQKQAGGQGFVLPSSWNIREALGECLRVCRVFTKDLLPKEKGGPDDGKIGVTAGGQPAPGSRADGDSQPFGSLGVETREEAFQALIRVSQYFRRAEPHSPISYALEQVVRWGRMSLPQLLSELVADRSAREEIFKRAGIVEESPEK